MSEIVNSSSVADSQIDPSQSVSKTVKGLHNNSTQKTRTVRSQQQSNVLTKRAPLPPNLRTHFDHVSEKYPNVLTNENEVHRFNTYSNTTHFSRPVSPPKVDNTSLCQQNSKRDSRTHNNKPPPQVQSQQLGHAHSLNNYTTTTSSQSVNKNKDVKTNTSSIRAPKRSLSNKKEQKSTAPTELTSARHRMGNAQKPPSHSKVDIPSDMQLQSKKSQIQAQRRRLSVSQSAAVRPDTPDSTRGQTVVSPSHSQNASVTNDGFNETAGAGRRRLSVSGVISTFKQDNFESKKQEFKSDFGPQNSDHLHLEGMGYNCKKGLKPESPNQDDFFIFKLDDYNLYGVFDGHGPFGHDVSNYVQREIPKLISSSDNFPSDIKLCLRRSFNEVHQKLDEFTQTPTASFDCTLSGSTATVVIHRETENKLYVAHVGDSRCVLGRKTPQGIEPVDLTLDHKPNSEAEEKRITEAGGEVRRLEGDIPHRVFVKGKYYPGLAMSRAIGDTVGTQAGIISDPEVSEHIIDKENDLFIILCSDGVWEFITSEEAVDIVHRHGYDKVQEAANELSTESWNRWINEEGNVVDDITIEIIYLRKPNA